MRFYCNIVKGNKKSQLSSSTKLRSTQLTDQLINVSNLKLGSTWACICEINYMWLPL